MAIDFSFYKEKVLNMLSRELSGMLSYHNVEHTAEVLEQTERIALAEGISDERQLLLLKLAALYHDTGFLFVYNGHEERGCEIATLDLLHAGLEPAEMDLIRSLIMATKVPQQPRTHMEQIICDADLDYLGRDDFWEISNNLKKEFLQFGFIGNENEWIKREIQFIEPHQYFTQAYQQLRSPEKLKHLKRLKALLNESAIEI
jgi:predicted metal-dependent HD superfamily phosphohydrolase